MPLQLFVEVDFLGVAQAIVSPSRGGRPFVEANIAVAAGGLASVELDVAVVADRHETDAAVGGRLAMARLARAAGRLSGRRAWLLGCDFAEADVAIAGARLDVFAELDAEAVRAVGDELDVAVAALLGRFRSALLGRAATAAGAVAAERFLADFDAIVELEIEHVAAFGARFRSR